MGPVKFVEPVKEVVTEPVNKVVVEKPISRELSKPIEPRRSNRVKKRKQLEIEEPAKTTKPNAPRKQRVVIQEPDEETEPIEVEQTKERELLKRNYVRNSPAPSSNALQLLQKLYNKDMLIFGRDRLFMYIQENHADIKDQSV